MPRTIKYPSIGERLYQRAPRLEKLTRNQLVEYLMQDPEVVTEERAKYYLDQLIRARLFLPRIGYDYVMTDFSYSRFKKFCDAGPRHYTHSYTSHELIEILLYSAPIDAFSSHIPIPTLLNYFPINMKDRDFANLISYATDHRIVEVKNMICIKLLMDDCINFLYKRTPNPLNKKVEEKVETQLPPQTNDLASLINMTLDSMRRVPLVEIESVVHWKAHKEAFDALSKLADYYG